MKKTLTAMALVLCFAAPAFANDADKSAKMDMKADHYMSKMDTNGDGYVSKDEHMAFADKMFKDADTNGDGKLSKDELKAKKMKEKEEWKAMKR